MKKNLHAQLKIPGSQRGVSMLMTLVALVVLLVTSIALVRSFDSTLLLAGNMAFKRDLVNQADRGVAAAITALSTGGTLATDSVRTSNLLTSNYSAIVLSANKQGIPLVLINDTTFSTVGMSSSKDITTSTGATVRYVIDRQCEATGSFSTASCAYISSEYSAGGTSWIKKAGAGNRPIYRISVRVSGPRNTMAYVQATVSR